jgi:alpha-beta hydrolase superfamily lysophospholipase
MGLFLVLAIVSGCVSMPRVSVPTSQTPRLARAHFVAADGAVLPARAWLPKGPARAVLVAIHGFNDYSRFFTSAGEFLASHGVASHAYDQRGFGHAPGHGLWAGEQVYTDDLHDFVVEVRRLHPAAPVFLLGESMGGAVAIVAATGPSPPPVDGLILSAPAVWGRETMPWYQRWLLAIGGALLPGWRLTGEGLGVRPSDNIEMLRGLGRDPLVIKATRIDALAGLADLMDHALQHASQLRLPTLVLYGDHDEVIPREPILRMLDRLPRTAQHRTAFYPHGHHLLLRDLHAEQAWADILTWLTDRDARLPSGADRRVAGARS